MKIKYNKWAAALDEEDIHIAGPWSVLDLEGYLEFTSHYEIADLPMIVFVLIENLDPIKVAGEIFNNKKVLNAFIIKDSFNRTYRLDYLLDPKRCPAIWKSKQ